MVWFNKKLEQIGIDKATHCAVAAFIVSLFAPFGMLSTMVGFVVAGSLALLKDYYLDNITDTNDIYWSFYGAAGAAIYFLLVNILLML